MNKCYFIIALLMTVLFAGCENQKPKITGQENSQIKEQILEEWGVILTAIESSDSEGYANFISPNLILMSSNGVVFHSKTEYIEKVHKWFSTRSTTEILQKKITVTVLEKDLVLLDQESKFLVNSKDGNIQSVQHAVTFVFKNEAMRWKIIHGHESFTDIE